MEGEVSFKNADMIGNENPVTRCCSRPLTHEVETQPVHWVSRYTCLVCSYRPVFDTVDTLTVHRKGKRHLEGETFSANGHPDL